MAQLTFSGLAAEQPNSAETEISQFQVAMLIDEQIIRLQVTVMARVLAMVS